MSTLTQISPPKSRRSPVLRILLWLVLAVIMMVAGLVGYGYYVAHAALPQLDGRVQISGLSAPVTVTRDGHGVPTIEAASLGDLFFTQGYVTAQDRLWQMDVMRRYGGGELSEILGDGLLKLDREQRILGLREAARKAMELASPRDRAFYESYARGVNAYIETHGNRLPIEFRILHYAPKQWQPEDSAVIANSMVKDLNYHYFYDALSREKILAKLGPELTADLYVNRSWHDRPPTVMREDLTEPDNTGNSDDEDDDDSPDNSVTQEFPASAKGLPVHASGAKALPEESGLIAALKALRHPKADFTHSKADFIQSKPDFIHPKPGPTQLKPGSFHSKPGFSKIPQALSAQALPTGTLPIQASSIQAPSTQASSIQALSIQALSIEPWLSGSSTIESSANEEVPVNGSNDWVVSGAHTVTGKPLLSNDMHLGHQMPNLWYEAHLHCGTLDVAGVTLPGMPYVIVGHNQRIAWGFTNVGPTVTDVFIENFNQEGAYQTPSGWVQPEHRAEVIHVKGKPDVNVDVRITRHGPVITELVPGETRQVALRWTLYDGLHIPFFDVNTAQNWDEFQRAFSQLDAPGQNVVYADVDGNIGYHTTGKVPIRAAGDGSLPVSGADNAHEWISYIPFEKLPSIYNPPSGIIATANGRITPDGYPNSISMEWEATWRTARIYHVLESGRQFSAADMLALQTDIQSEAVLFAAERLVYAVDHAAKPSARAKQAADLMRSWDGRMLAASAASTIAENSIGELRRLLLEPKLGRAPSESRKEADSELYKETEKNVIDWKTYSWLQRSVWMENILLHRPKRWLPEQYPNYDELLTAAVEAAVNHPQAPRDLASWRWGSFNAVDIQHPILGKIPVIKRWSGPGVQEQSGSGYTVKAVTPYHGPSERFTANMANLDESTLNTVTGQGGNFLSPYYMDQWKAWYEGSTFSLPFTPKAVEAAKTHRLVLEPFK